METIPATNTGTRKINKQTLARACAYTHTQGRARAHTHSYTFCIYEIEVRRFPVSLLWYGVRISNNIYNKVLKRSERLLKNRSSFNVHLFVSVCMVCVFAYVCDVCLCVCVCVRARVCAYVHTRAKFCLFFFFFFTLTFIFFVQ